MATPTKAEILERATELYYQSNPPTTNSPEIEELKESGFYWAAQCELMRTPYKEFEPLSKYEKPENLVNFPIDAIMKEGCFVTGARGCGKSNLVKWIVKQLLACKVQVKVIDPSLAWKDYPYLHRIKVVQNSSIECKLNAVHDLSRISVVQAREFVKLMMAEDTKHAIESTDLELMFPLLYVLEEVQNLVFPNTLRMVKYQDVSRFITQGRNFGLSYIAATQRLGSVDANLIEISGVRFWFKLEGENNLRKAKAWLDKTHIWKLRDLEVGSCYMQHGSEIERIKVPLFEFREVIA